MKLLVGCFLVVAINYASSLPANSAASPCSNPDNSNAIDTNKLISNIADALVPAKTAVTINGNVTIQILNATQSCCNQQESSTESPAPAPERPKLPEGYVTISEADGYITGIKLYPTKQKFNAARKTCLHEGAFLAYATSKEEEDAYLQLMRDNEIIDVWTGIHDLFEKFDWSTIRGEVASEVAYFKWRKGQPDNSSNNEECTHLREAGLNDINCNNEYPFICKIQLPLAS